MRQRPSAWVCSYRSRYYEYYQKLTHSVVHDGGHGPPLPGPKPLVAGLQRQRRDADTHVALMGHEPDLSEMLGWLVAGRRSAFVSAAAPRERISNSAARTQRLA